MRVAAVAAALLLSSGGCGADEQEVELNGTVLKDAESAPNFSLSNQLGQTVTLDSLGGRVVALTFLYTNCPSVCPIVTSQLREVYEGLGTDAELVEFVVISVDPERDTAEAARAYLDRWKLSDGWGFLVGNRADLEPVWKSYYIDPAIDDPDTAALVSRAPASAAPSGAIDALRSEIAQRFDVIHSAPVYLIDPDGRRRVVFTPPLDAPEIVEDIRALLGGG